MTSERSITNAIRRKLEQLGCFVLKLHGSAYQRKGLPDLLVQYRGRSLWLEVKRPGAPPPTTIQLRTMAEIEGRAEVPCRTVRSLETALDYAERLLGVETTS